MYIIINKTRETCTKHIGDFPDLEEWLDKGDRIIVISLYSNTIKVPYKLEHNGIVEWEWEDYSLSENVLISFKGL
jgi:hypothetical protein